MRRALQEPVDVPEVGFREHMLTWVESVRPEVWYVLLLLLLFVFPRVLQRFRIPRAITSLGFGAILGLAYPPLRGDATVQLFATFGIVALFLFAGLDVELEVLRRESRVLAQHLVLGFAVLLGTAWGLREVLGLGPRPAALIALALLTPSAGFILETLDTLVASTRERFWIRSKVIATELLALGVLFVTLQSETWVQLSISAVTLAAMIAVLPGVFRLFARLVVPHAPKSEFAFLLMVAVVCGMVTYNLGVYYLVGAFVVGMAAQRFRQRLPAIASEKMLDAVEAFASLFVPFYFFHAGLSIERRDLTWESLLAGVAFFAVAFPLRIASVAGHRRVMLGETWRNGLRISIAMLPTLVFTLVLAQILRERFDAPPYVFGGLIVYAVLTTLIPTYALRLPPPEFDAPTAPAIGYGRDVDEEPPEEAEARGAKVPQSTPALPPSAAEVASPGVEVRK